ncbi:MAG: UDP-3-O-(3-hydroxymyristoyl)glucosamine N-acyltransferase [Candidatus Cloacimonetes bacterium]|nr:UDP-3-O-(3-hydroxymyristoyl)glucosamine N-acyltransferase [Candidatus Cloacimonadota bacterium]
MKIFKQILKPELIAAQIPGRLVIRAEVFLDNVAELEEANNHSVCFYQDKKYFKKLLSSKAGLVFVPADFDENILPEGNLFKVEIPYIYFMLLVQKWLELDQPQTAKKIAPNAMIAGDAEIAEDVELGSGVYIGSKVKIGKGSVLEANCVVRENTVIGENCHFFPNVTVYHDCVIGNDVILHSGVRIGADGFGYLLHDNKQFKLPQVGNVIIKDEVEIGANSCVDRATLGSTIIGKGTKLDNLVQVGHNCVIGENSILCAQVGLAGNTYIGDRVYLAGQVGTADHVTIGDDVMVGAQSGVAGNVAADTKVFGYPAREAGLTRRIMASEKYLPELVRYYRKEIKEKN